MASTGSSTPVPRSYSEILGDMIAAFLSKYGIPALKVGSPVLSMLESSAQSDLRSSEDIFTLLQASSLDQAAGTALDRIGADEGLPRLTVSPANGVVTITDTSFLKISNKIFQGTSAPIVGSGHVNLTDASDFTPTGSIYIGRGTNNYEGPLAYSAILPPGDGGGQSGGNYWTLTLATGTQRFHNQGEPAVLAQGGNRSVPAGTVVQTPQGNVVNAVQYNTQYAAILPDGETSITGITVVAISVGVAGNIGAGGINAFSSAPFTGASVTNPAPFTNGVAAEDDDSYRERIRLARRSRTKGTGLAIQTSAVGVTAPDENKRVLSASLISNFGQPTVLYIDDGTGYEESDAGIAIEALVDLAIGGENYFKTSFRPVAKAFVATTEFAPFVLAAGQQLAFEVGGVATVHTFSADEFQSIGNATAYEVVASINADSLLNWSARTASSATAVVVFAKSDTNEDITNVSIDPTQGVDANAFLGFPSGQVDTMRLYRNDRLLTKDGSQAVIVGNGSSTWGALSSPEDLALQVDGTPMTNLVAGTFTFTDQDFVNAATGFTTLGRNTPNAWAAVFNYRIPGITATVVNGIIYITSNAGRTTRAQLNVIGGSLVTQGMFASTPVPVVGANSDYQLDRNTGELALATPLVAGDRLTIGSTATRAFLQTPSFSTVTVAGTDAQLWFAVDGDALIISTSLTAGTPVTLSDTSESWGFRQRMTGASGMFTNVLVGDWVVFWDSSSPAELLNNTYRIAAIDASASAWVEFDLPTALTPGSQTFTAGGVVFVRASSPLQQVTIPIGTNYTASSLVPLLNAVLVGALAVPYQTTAYRVQTESFSDVYGSVALVAANLTGQLLGLTPANATLNLTGHQASVEAGNSELGTPDFQEAVINSGTGSGDPTVLRTVDAFFGSTPHLDSFAIGATVYQDGTTTALTRWGNDRDFDTTYSALISLGGNSWQFTMRENPLDWFNGDRVRFASPYRLSPVDQLTVLIDQDTDQKRFVVPFWRTLTPIGTTYGTTNTFVDADNGGQSLTQAFGYAGGPITPFAFEDFAVFMQARGKTHPEGNDYTSLNGSNAYSATYTYPPNSQNDLTRAILWRYVTPGVEGNYARVAYALPSAASQPVAVTVDSYTSQYTNVSIVLASGPQSVGYTLSPAYPIGTVALTAINGLSTAYYLLAFPATNLVVAGGGATGTLTVTFPAGLVHSGLDLTGSTSYYFVSATGGVTTQNVTISAETLNGGIYNELTLNFGTAGTAGTYANPGTLYLAASTTATFAGASPAVAQGSFFMVGNNAALPTGFTGTPLRIQNDPSATPFWLQAVIPSFTGSVSTTMTYAATGDATAFQIYGNPAQTAATIAAAVTALADSDPAVPVLPTLLGSGAMIIDRASAEDAGSTSTMWTSLTDGINYVSATIAPGSLGGNYQLTFKGGVNSSLTTDSDWANEVVKIVPRTALNVMSWLNVPSVSGLFSVSEVSLSDQAHKVQIASLTPGSLGSVQVQGGTANEAFAAVVGSGVTVGSQMVATINGADAPGFVAGGWVSVDNADLLRKTGIFTSGTILESIVASGNNHKITLDGSTNLYTQTGSSASSIVMIERQGNFVALVDSGDGAALATNSVNEGDWIYIYAPSSYTYHGQAGYEAVGAINTGNVGIYRVVRVVPASQDLEGHGGTIWIENPAAEEQLLAECSIITMTANSVMPGDTLSISTTLWNGTTSNQGNYQVVSVGDNGSGPFTDANVMVVSGVMSAVTGPTTALGTNYPQVQIVEQSVGRFIKQIIGFAPNQLDDSLTDVKFTTSAGVAKIGAVAGSVLTALDKLDFSTDIVDGVDGYQYAVGLIAEVNKVTYGFPSDPTTYPGVAAAGAQINIQGPLVKRVQVTISLRIRTGAAQQDIEDRVQSALASIINQAGIGESIALSDLTTAAGQVGGVISAVMVSPVATAGNDLIDVQPYEKPLVLDVDTDITVSFAGQ